MMNCSMMNSSEVFPSEANFSTECKSKGGGVTVLGNKLQLHNDRKKSNNNKTKYV